jgi:hypothetical protein
MLSSFSIFLYLRKFVWAFLFDRPHKVLRGTRPRFLGKIYEWHFKLNDTKILRYKKRKIDRGANWSVGYPCQTMGEHARTAKKALTAGWKQNQL